MRLGRYLEDLAAAGNPAAGLVLQEGQSFAPRLRPALYAPGRYFTCHRSSRLLARGHAELTHIEGFASMPWELIDQLAPQAQDFAAERVSLLISNPSSAWCGRHAWCVDDTGALVDVTWPFHPALEYRGVSAELLLSVDAPAYQELEAYDLTGLDPATVRRFAGMLAGGREDG